MTFARTIVEHPSVQAYLDEALPKNPRLDDLWEALKWRIARDPEAGLRVVEGSPPFLYVVRTRDNSPGIPVIRAAYRFNPSLPVKVEIIGVKVVGPTG